MARREDGSSGKIEIHLDGGELRYFDALRGDMSRAAFARILMDWAIEHPENAFAHHFEMVKSRFGNREGLE